MLCVVVVVRLTTATALFLKMYLLSKPRNGVRPQYLTFLSFSSSFMYT